MNKIKTAAIIAMVTVNAMAQSGGGVITSVNNNYLGGFQFHHLEDAKPGQIITLHRRDGTYADIRCGVVCIFGDGAFLTNVAGATEGDPWVYRWETRQTIVQSQWIETPKPPACSYVLETNWIPMVTNTDGAIMEIGTVVSNSISQDCCGNAKLKHENVIIDPPPTKIVIDVHYGVWLGDVKP